LKLTGKPFLLLGAVTTATPKSLHTSLSSPLVQSLFEGLVDSGSSDCFLDSDFVAKNKLLTREIAPLPIALIDGTVNIYVTRVISLPINLTCGYGCTPEFYVTKLEDTYLAVLGYSWLVGCNPNIDWVKGTIACKGTTSSQPISPPPPAPGNTVGEPTKPSYPPPGKSPLPTTKISRPSPEPVSSTF